MTANSKENMARNLGPDASGGERGLLRQVESFDGIYEQYDPTGKSPEVVAKVIVRLSMQKRCGSDM
jgi:hypothetical protein